MAVMIQIRNVPPAVHKRLKMQAVSKGMSLSEYLLEEVKQIAAHPTREEWVERMLSRPRSNLNPTALLREERDRE